MTATTDGMGAGGPPRYTAPDRSPSFGNLVRAEWIRYFSLRSLVGLTTAAAALIVGLSALFAVFGATMGGAEGGGNLATSLVGTQLAVLLVAAAAVTFITGEHSTGSIRTSYLAAPTRTPVLLAKAVVVGAVVVIVLGSATVVAVLLGHVLGSGDTDAGEAVRLVAGNVVVLMGIAVAGLAIGAVVRGAAAGIGAVVVLIFVVPAALLALPEFPGKEVAAQVNLGALMFRLTETSGGEPGLLGAAGAAVGLVSWVGGLLALGTAASARHDV